MTERLSSGETLCVFPYDWVVKDRFTDSEQVAIHVWCLNRDSQPYLLRIEDFQCYCYLELPSVVQRKAKVWTSESVRFVVSALSHKLKDHAPISFEFREMKKIYYYRGRSTYPMILLGFRNLESQRHCQNVLKWPLSTNEWGPLKCFLWETKIPLVRKLLTYRNMTYSQWMEVFGIPVPEADRISVLEHEYKVSWKTLHPIPMEVSQPWRFSPRLLAFDIECYSHNPQCLPNEWSAPDVVFMISCIYQKLGEVESRARYGIVWGECLPIPEETLPKTTLFFVSSEFELIEQMATLVRHLDPEIVTGYNIFGFDYRYLDARLRRTMQTWPEMGRLYDQKPVMESFAWSSSAFKHNEIHHLLLDGRIHLDLFPLIQREHKLMKYTLDFVSQHFLGKSKHDVSPQEIFWVREKYAQAAVQYRSMLADRKDLTVLLEPVLKSLEELLKKLLPTKEDLFSAYRRFDSFSGEFFSDAGNAWANTWKEFFKVHSLDPEGILRWVLVLRMMFYLMLYCIQDSELVLDLIERLNTCVGLIQMSNVTGVTLVELHTRGQQLRCLSLLYDMAAKNGFVLDDVGASGYRFQGGFVNEPIPGLHENVICWDFASLYPTIIMAYNVCFTTLVHPDQADEVPDEQCHVIEFEQEEPEVSEDPTSPCLKSSLVLRKYRFKYIKTFPGLLPQLVRKLVDERSVVRKLAETETDPITRLVLNQRQLALKTVANSFYGFLGVHQGGKMPLIEGAMTITAIGRQSILKVNEYLQTHYGGRIVYNDTDSSMVDLQIQDPQEVLRKGKELSQELSNLFPSPMKMEFEKAMRLLCLRKKRYVAALIDFKTGQLKLDPSTFLYRGIELARRDRPPWLRDIQKAVIEKIMTLRPFEEALEVVLEGVDRLVSGKVPYQELITIQGVNANYKNKSCKMAVFSNELKKLGKPVEPGARVEFLVVKNDQARLLGERMRLPETYLEGEEEIDALYYIEHILMNPINQLISVGYQETLSKLRHLGFRPSGRHKFIDLTEPVLLIHRMILHGLDFRVLSTAVRKELERLSQPPQLRIHKEIA